MRPNPFDFEKKPPFFRPPKYTGITLSLLSVFVLVSMLAVWEKMAHVPELQEIKILAWKKSKLPIEKVRVAYQKEASCILHATYLSLTELSGLHVDTNQTQWDVLLLPKTELLDPFFAHNQYDSRGTFAYFRESNDETGQAITTEKPIPLVCLINQSKQNNAEILSFLRFLKAPTQGQVEFAINGWTGVSEDHWDISPELKIYAVQSCQSWLSPSIQNFARKEGIELSISFLEEKNLHKSLSILTKANNKNYLPDLICFPTTSTNPIWLHPYFSELKNDSHPLPMEYSLYLRKQSPLLKTMQKLLPHLSESQ